MNSKQYRYEAQLEMLCSQMLMGALASVSLGCFGVVVFWDVSITSELLMWFALLILSSAANYGLAVKTKNHSGQTALQSLNNFTFLGVIAGVIWAIPSYWLVSGQPEIIQPGFGSMFIIVAVMGLATSAMGSTSAYLPFYYCSVSPFALAILFACANADLSLQKILVPLVIFFSAIYWFTFNINRGLIKAIDLKHDNEKLANDYLKEKEKAQAADRKKSQFLAAASHDLRQPLQALVMYSELLKDELTTNSSKAILTNQLAAITNLEALLTALLDISNLDSNLDKVVSTHFSINELFEKLAANFDKVAKEQGIELTFSVGKLWVKSDYVLLFRCVSNLIDNALKHSKATRILVVARKQKSQVKLYVMDNGKGVSKIDQTRIFDEFEQVGNLERNRAKGLGLGLSIVKRTLDMLKHELHFSSEVGCGCCFIIDLPLGLIEVKQSRIDKITSFSLADIVVWIIDDEDDIRHALSVLLSKWGAKVLTAANREELGYLLTEQTGAYPNLIISDYRLPDKLDGCQVVNIIREHFNADIPALFITGDTSPDKIAEIKQSSIPMLQKPVSGAKVRLAIKKVVNL